MSQTHPLPDIDDEVAEAEALARAVAESDADPRTVPHEEMRAWLLRIAAGEFDAEPPEPR
jgi:Fe-S-cluster formation regulator IscX/YfhJ